MEKEKKQSKKWYKIWWVWLVIGIFIILIIIPTEDKPTEQVDNTEQIEASVPQEIATVEKDTLTLLWEAVDKGLGTREGVDVNYISEENYVQVSRYIDTVWDENDVVRKNISDLVKFGEKAFELEGIQEITVITRTDFIDTYGNSSEGTAVSCNITKDEFNKFNWGALEYMPILNQMEQSCNPLVIRPSIKLNIDPEKIYYSPL